MRSLVFWQLQSGYLLRAEKKEGTKAGTELSGNSMTYIIPLDFYYSKIIRKINVVISILEAFTFFFFLTFNRVFYKKTNIVICLKYSRPFTNSFIFIQQDIIQSEMYDICMSSLDPLQKIKRIQSEERLAHFSY